MSVCEHDPYCPGHGPHHDEAMMLEKVRAHATPEPDPVLAGNMVETYRQQMQREDDFLHHAEQAPALFKPEGIRAAQEKFTKAAREMTRWSR